MLFRSLPLVTCVGDSYAARMAGSIVNAAGLPELVTRTFEDYEALALKLATDPGMLGGIKARLASNRMTCPLFDTDRFRRHIDAAYVTMWERQQRGEAPATFSITAIS